MSEGYLEAKNGESEQKKAWRALPDPKPNFGQYIEVEDLKKLTRIGKEITSLGQDDPERTTKLVDKAEEIVAGLPKDRDV